MDVSAEARDLIARAKEGFATAQKELGDHYYAGNKRLGIPEDRMECMKWLSRAAVQGDREAIYDLHILASVSKLACLEEGRVEEYQAVHRIIAFYEREAELYAGLYGVTLPNAVNAEQLVAHEDYVAATHYDM